MKNVIILIFILVSFIGVIAYKSYGGTINSSKVESDIIKGIKELNGINISEISIRGQRTIGDTEFIVFTYEGTLGAVEYERLGSEKYKRKSLYLEGYEGENVNRRTIIRPYSDNDNIRIVVYGINENDKKQTIPLDMNGKVFNLVGEGKCFILDLPTNKKTLQNQN